MNYEARTMMTIGGSLVVGVAYGLCARLAMDAPPVMEVMSIGFIFVMPLVIGFLTGAAAPRRAKTAFRILFPCLTVTLFMLGTLVFLLEGAICVAMMAPVALAMAMVGGAASSLVFRREDEDWREGPPRKPYAALLLLPFVVAAIEGRLDLPEETREVWSRIEIAADADAVWREIVAVPLIRNDERRPGFIHDIGFPYPLEATIVGEGVGAIRHASFEGGILFQEVVTAWEPRRLLSFSIDVDAESVPTTTLDRHVVVGGAYFDTLDGTYRIEEHTDGFVTLHLGSRHRLSTRFNPYAALWTDAIMASIQDEILHVIHDRAESR